MFLDYFGLTEQPFGVTPDPRFLYLGQKHREALASLTYGVENTRGFLALIAPPGMGKTSLLFHYLETARNQARTAFLFQPARNLRELLSYLLTDLGINPGGKDVPGMHEKLNRVLIQEMNAGRRLILAIDEAQNLDTGVLESIRVLSNFETPWMKLIQIVIAGQPQLAEVLSRPSMAQLRQRISSIIRLEALTQEETNAYIAHRLWVAGYSGPQLFTVGARLLIDKHSGGIPRNINNLCFHALGLACALEKKQVTSDIVSEVVADLALDSQPAHEAKPSRPATLQPSAEPGIFATPTRRGFTFALAAAFAALSFGLVCGATWKTDAGSFATAKHAFHKAAALPPPMAPVMPGALPSIAALTAPRSDSAGGSPAPDPALIPVVVPRNVTLRHLCLTYLNRFDQRTLEAIARLNPEVTDPNRLRAGQLILLPLKMGKISAASPLTHGPSAGDSHTPRSVPEAQP